MAGPRQKASALGTSTVRRAGWRKDSSSEVSEERLGNSGAEAVVSKGSGGRESQEDQAALWHCPACSFANHGLLAYCEICETPRPLAGACAGSRRGTPKAERGDAEAKGESAGSGSAGGGGGGGAEDEGLGGRSPSADSEEGEGQREEKEEGSEPRGEETGQEWSCSRCSFLNVGLLPYCEICEFSRAPDALGSSPEEVSPATGHSSPVAASPSAGASRPCPLCSFLNAAGRTACEICEAPLEGLAEAASGRTSGTGAEESPGTSACEEFVTPPSSPSGAAAVVAAPAGPKQGRARQRAARRARAAEAAASEAQQQSSPSAAASSRRGSGSGGSGSSRPSPPAAEPQGAEALKPRNHEAGGLRDSAAAEEERRLLLSMGWVPAEEDGEGGLEDWEVDAAQESFIRHLQAEPHEDLRARARREFEAWKAEQAGDPG